MFVKTTKTRTTTPLTVWKSRGSRGRLYRPSSGHGGCGFCLRGLEKRTGKETSVA
jgi:hypothetical protein